MKNLIVANHKVFNLKREKKQAQAQSHKPSEIPGANEDAQALQQRRPEEALGSVITMDVANHVIYYCTAGLTLIGYDLRNNKQTLSVPLVLPDDAEEPLLYPDDVVIAMQYLPEKESVFLATQSGYLITVTVHSQGEMAGQMLSEEAMALIANSEDAVLNPFAAPLGDDQAAEAGNKTEVGSVEVLGLIEGGLSCAEWSPDKELLVLCGCTGGLILMSKAWDIVVDTKIRGDAEANNAIVNANPYHYFQTKTNNYVTGAYKELNEAGKLRLQQLQKPAVEEKANSDDEKDNEPEVDDTVIQAANSSEAVRVFTASAQAAARAAEAAAKNGEDTDATVSWRGDGQYFVVSSFNQVSGTRTIRVWNRQGQLQSVSEQYPAQNVALGTPVSQGRPSVDPVMSTGMHPAISWRPSGNYIATVQRTLEPGTVQGEMQRQHKVVLFERNGLKRHDFALFQPDSRTAQATSIGIRSPFQISQLAWNCDSELLMIAGIDHETGTRLVQIWYNNNGHWYLKQVLTFRPYAASNNTTTEVALHAYWHPDRPYRLYVAVDSTEFHLFDLCFDHVVSPAPLSSAAVVDGQVILITHLSKAAVPPPLASKAVSCPDPIAEVAYCPTVALSNLLLHGDALAGDTIRKSDSDEATAGGRYRSTGKGTFSDVPPSPPAPLAAPALSAATQCSPAAIAAARGGTAGSAVRLDLTAPLAALTGLGDVLLITEAVEPTYEPSKSSETFTTLFSQNPPHAPAHQPERYMLSGPSSGTFAKPAAYAKLSIPHLLKEAGCGSEVYGAAHFRHLQWADATQWLAVHSALARNPELKESLKRVAADFGNDAMANSVLFQDAVHDTQVHHAPSLLGRMVAKAINVPAHASNCITLIESRKGRDWYLDEDDVPKSLPKDRLKALASSSERDRLNLGPSRQREDDEISVSKLLKKEFESNENFESEPEDDGKSSEGTLNSLASSATDDNQVEDESEHLIQIQFRVYLTERGTLHPFDIMVRRFPIQATLLDPPAKPCSYMSLLANSSQDEIVPGRLALLSSVAAAARDMLVAQEQATNPAFETTSNLNHDVSADDKTLPVLIAFEQPLVSRVHLVNPGRPSPDPTALFAAFGLASDAKGPEAEKMKADILNQMKPGSSLIEWMSKFTDAQRSAVVAYTREYAAYTTSRPWLAMLLSDGRILGADLPFYVPTAIVQECSRLKTRSETLQEQEGDFVSNDDESEDGIDDTDFGDEKPAHIPTFSTKRHMSLRMESVYAPKLLNTKSFAPMDALWFQVSAVHHRSAFIAKDTLARLWVNNVLVAPQCLSFSVLHFADLATSSSQGANPSKLIAENSLSRRLLAETLPDPLLPSYLLVTVASQSHALFTLDLRKTLAENLDPLGSVRDDPSMIRFVERGAMIVTALADLQRPRVVLQQPRGNLELVYPRSLGLAAIQVALSRQDYYQAFLSMRANRIDLNLLYDHDPMQFEKYAEDVILQLSAASTRSASSLSTTGTDALSLFLSALTDEDCTKTQYPYYHSMFADIAARHILASAVSSSSLLSTTLFEHGLVLADADKSFDYASAISTMRRRGASGGARKITGGIDVVSYARKHVEGDEPHDAFSLGNASSWDGSQEGNRSKFKGPHGHDSLEELARALGQKRSGDATGCEETKNGHAPMPIVSEDDIQLGEEAHADLTRDGTGLAVMKKESRVQRWNAADMDIRHVYAQATEEQDAADAKRAKESNDTKSQKPLSAVTSTAGPDQKAQAPATSIINELVTQSEQDTNQVLKKLGSATSKINRVCALVLATLDRLDPDPLKRTYMIPALTAHLRSTPPQFTGAVTRIAQLAHAEAKQVAKVSPNGQVDKSQSKVEADSSEMFTDPTTGVKYPKFTTPPESYLRPHPLSASSGSNSRQTSPLITAEGALKYVLILSDGNELWRAALSLYDLNLAASIAQFHGRDPKEYLPFLASYQRIAKVGPQLSVTINAQKREALASVPVPVQIGDVLMRASIDIHLERYAQALVHWADALKLIRESLQTDITDPQRDKLKCTEITLRKSILDTLKRAQLFELGVLLFGHEFVRDDFTVDCLTSPDADTSSALPDHRDPESVAFGREVLSMYAAWLESAGVSRFADAAVAYRLIGDIRSACTAYGNAGMWQAAMGLAAVAAVRKVEADVAEEGKVVDPTACDPIFDQAGIVALARRLASLATERKDYQAAAELHYEYLNDPETAVSLLIRGAHWNDVLALAAKHRMRTLTNPAMVSVAHLTWELIIPSLRAAASARVSQYKAAAERFPIAARRLRIVRRLKILIFSGKAKRAPNTIAGGGTGEITRLPARIPGDDILEFIITGVWRGVHVGFDVGGDGGDVDKMSVAASSLARYSTATGASLASLAPSIARSIRSSRSAALSGVSVASQSSVLSAAALETALTPDERRIQKYQQRKERKQNKRKVKEGDPREELELVKELRQLTPQPKDHASIAALAHALGFFGLEREREEMLTSLSNLLTVIAEVEATPMPTLEDGSDWQREQIAAYFNWPASNYVANIPSAPLPGGATKPPAANEEDDEEPEASMSGAAVATFYGNPTSVGIRAALSVAKTYGDWRSLEFSPRHPVQMPTDVSGQPAQSATAYGRVPCSEIMSPLAQLLSNDPDVKSRTMQALLEEAEAESKKLAIMMSSKRTQLGAASAAISATTSVSTPKH